MYLFDIILATKNKTTSMPTAEPHPYYLQRRSIIVADFLESLRLSSDDFKSLVPQHPLEQLKPAVLEELDRVLATLPYVGGESGRMTPFFEQSAGFFALGRVLRSLQVPMDTTAALMRKTFLSRLLNLSHDERIVVGRDWLSEDNQALLRMLATTSQERRDPGDFVYEFVDRGTTEEGEAFDFGLDYNECGFCKLCKANGDEELLPVMCSMDKESYSLRGIKLLRSKTIAAGDGHCNFRFSMAKEDPAE